ncbi:MAG TPA: glycine betaine ABC transporter substrate-binding protein, partial [Terriglobales bacterium]|nr:glycine betaine ABC transporter substrate-binding protein [Terriglobales bacterium]
MKIRLLALLALLLSADACRPHSSIVVGSKNFTEQAILGEILAQHLEQRTGLPVERRFYLAGSYICHQALLAGRIDMYVEYTGTALTAILKEKPTGDRQAVYDLVKQQYDRRFGLQVQPSLGFNNSFAMVIRGEDARRLHLRTLSQAEQYSSA